MAGSLIPGIVQPATERDGLLKVKLLEGPKSAVFLKTVDGGAGNVNTGVRQPAGGLHVEPVGTFNPLVFFVVFHCPVSNGSE